MCSYMLIPPPLFMRYCTSLPLMITRMYTYLVQGIPSQFLSGAGGLGVGEIELCHVQSKCDGVRGYVSVQSKFWFAHWLDALK